MSLLKLFCLIEEIGLGTTPLERELGVAPIVEKMVETMLRWLGHVERRPVDIVVQRVDKMEESRIRRG